MQAIGALARAHGIKVVEDASHAIGATYLGRPVGDCAHSDICVFSFHPVKIVTTAEGGLATTQDAGLARAMDLARSHGITRDPAQMTHAPDGAWYYQQITLGYNYRMTEIQAALGLSQLDRLHDFVAARHRIADRYAELLAGLPLRSQAPVPGSHSALHLYVIRLDDPTRHRAVFDAMRAGGIGVNLHYIPVHTQPYYQALGHRPGDYPASEAYYASAISLPMYPGLTPAMQDRVVATLRAALA
jgi:dTDP-4-amino-4,6-dideoxygalactose transaminase